MRRSLNIRLTSQRGLTLTELMISIVLGLFLIGGVLNVVLGGLTTFRTNDSLSRIQESGRFAMELMRRDLRQAGYFGCRQSLVAEIPRDDSALSPGFIRNTLNPAPAGGTDALAWDHNYTLALEGFTATDPAGGSGWTVTIPTNALITSPLDHSDVVVSSSAEGTGVIVAPPHGGFPPGSDDIVVADPSGITAGDVLMVTDCTSAAIFEVTGLPTIAHDVGAGTPGNYTEALGRGFAGGEIFAMTKSAFYIADSAITGRPALFRNGDELVQDVDRLRVLYGIDINLDRRIDSYVSAGTAPLDGDAATDPDWENVIAVQVNLLISSGEEDNLTEVPVSVPFAGGTFTATDRRLYQVFTATIGVRNRLP